MVSLVREFSPSLKSKMRVTRRSLTECYNNWKRTSLNSATCQMKNLSCLQRLPTTLFVLDYQWTGLTSGRWISPTLLLLRLVNVVYFPLSPSSSFLDSGIVLSCDISLSLSSNPQDVPLGTRGEVSVYDVISHNLRVIEGAGMAQWWEHSPPTNVVPVRFLYSASYLGWVFCWL